MVYIAWAIYVVSIAIAASLRWILVRSRESQLAISIVVPNLVMVVSMLFASSEPWLIPRTLDIMLDVVVRVAASTILPLAVAGTFIAVRARHRCDKMLICAVILGAMFTFGLEFYAIARHVALGAGDGWSYFPASVAPWDEE